MAKRKKPSKDYDVGYKKPPKHTQFKPGESGNPKGRPKGSKNIETEVREFMNELVTLRVGGQAQRVTKTRAMLLALFDKGAQKDVRAIQAFFSLSERYQPREEEADAETMISEDEREIVRAFEAKLRRTTVREEKEHRHGKESSE